MSWRVWVGKHDAEIRHLRGLIDEIIVICEDEKLGLLKDWSNNSLADEILKAIQETQDEYEEA